MNEETACCEICGHSEKAHSRGHCFELKSKSSSEPNRAVFAEGCTCTGFVPKV